MDYWKNSQGGYTFRLGRVQVAYFKGDGWTFAVSAAIREAGRGPGPRR